METDVSVKASLVTVSSLCKFAGESSLIRKLDVPTNAVQSIFGFRVVPTFYSENACAI